MTTTVRRTSSDLAARAAGAGAVALPVIALTVAMFDSALAMAAGHLLKSLVGAR